MPEQHRQPNTREKIAKNNYHEVETMLSWPENAVPNRSEASDRGNILSSLPFSVSGLISAIMAPENISVWLFVHQIIESVHTPHVRINFHRLV